MSFPSEFQQAVYQFKNWFLLKRFLSQHVTCFLAVLALLLAFIWTPVLIHNSASSTERYPFTGLNNKEIHHLFMAVTCKFYCHLRIWLKTIFSPTLTMMKILVTWMHLNKNIYFLKQSLVTKLLMSEFL